MKTEGKFRKEGRYGSPGRVDGSSADPEERVILPRGDYHSLHSFHKAEVVYESTFRFAHRFLVKATARWTR